MSDPFFSEIKYLGGPNADFIEVVVEAGYDVSNLVVTVYKVNGTIRSSNDLSLLTPTTVNGKDIYLIENGDATNFNGIALSEAVSLSENGTVFAFLSFSDVSGGITANVGPASGMTSTDIGSAGNGSSLETTDGGATYFTQNTPDPNNVTCLTAGANIETNSGSVKIEELEQGALIRTFDGGYKPLRRVFTRTIGNVELARNPKLYPVLITAGAIGPGLPKKDLLVSRQHRMVVSSAIAKRMFGTSEVFIAAIKLTCLPGIFLDRSVSKVEYYHLLFDDHEVIFADGAPTESLFLGAEAMASLPSETICEIREIFPNLSLPLEHSSAKLNIPPNHRQAKLVQRHLKNRRCLVSAG